MKSKCSSRIKDKEIPSCINDYNGDKFINELLVKFNGISQVISPLKMIIENNYEVVEVTRFREPFYGSGLVVEKITINYEDEFKNEYECKIIIK